MDAQTEKYRILRHRAVDDRTGDSKATRARRVAAGTFPPPVSCGSPNMKGWIESEVDVAIAARVADKSDEYMRSLVTWLVDQREGTAAALLPPDELLKAS